MFKNSPNIFLRNLTHDSLSSGHDLRSAVSGSLASTKEWRPMRTILVAFALVLPAAGSSRITPTPVAPTPFSVVLDYTPTGWSVDCEIGCSWKASFECETACSAIVDAKGLITLANDRAMDPRFAFVV